MSLKKAIALFIIFKNSYYTFLKKLRIYLLIINLEILTEKTRLFKANLSRKFVHLDIYQ